MGVYYGSTAGALANPPVPVFAALARSVSPGSTGGIGALGGSNLWFYASTNLPSEASAANFMTDAYYLGMRPGDVVIGSYQSSIGSSNVASYRLIASAVSTLGAIYSTAQMSTV